MDDSLHEIARDTLEQYRNLQVANANEAETRLKIIDVILYQLLGWTHDDVHVEERVEEDEDKPSYADYIVRTGNTAFVIEAKKVGRTFSDASSRRRIKLTKGELSGEIGAAVRQARDYARSNNIPFAVVTNGAQWIVFPAVRVDGVKFASSSALVFDSLESVLGEDFEEFFSLLSRVSVVNGSLEQHLLGRNVDQVEERRLKSFFSPTQTRPANPILPLIDDAIVASFTDSYIENDDDLLQRAYVSTPDRTRFDGRIRMHISKHEPLFETQPKRPMRKKEAGAVEEKIKKAQSSSVPVAVFVLGPVGAGKTTFLNYTRRVSQKEYFEPRKDQAYPHWIQIDFRGFSPNDSAIDFIYQNVFAYIKEDLFFSDYYRAIRSAYAEDIAALRRGPLALVSQDDASFNERITEILKSDYDQVRPYVDKLVTYATKVVPVFLVIDNVDQFESESIQASIFADAMALAVRLGVNITISMRESTFVRHKDSAVFDAFDFDPLAIEHPSIDAVLAKRLNIAKYLLTGRPGEFRAQNGALVKVEDLSIFMEIIQKSVLGTEVGRRIGVLADGDVRLALRMTRHFLERGYTDPGKAIEYYKNNNSYTLPPHEAFRAVLIGNNVVYDEDYATVGNPFDARLAKTSDQMLRLFVMAALVRMSSEATFRYATGVHIRNSIRSIGFPDEHVHQVLQSLCALRFVHTSSHGEASFASNYYPTRLGGYVVRELIAEFTFLENVLMDTFISDNEVWENLRRLSEDIRDERDTVKKIVSRVERVKVFYSYCEEMFTLLTSEAMRRSLGAEWCTNPLAEKRQQMEKNCEIVRRSAERIYGGKGR